MNVLVAMHRRPRLALPRTLGIALIVALASCARDVPPALVPPVSTTTSERAQEQALELVAEGALQPASARTLAVQPIACGESTAASTANGPRTCRLRIVPRFAPGALPKPVIMLRVEEPESGVVLHEAPFFHDPTLDREFSLPVGRYTIAAEGRSMIDRHHGIVMFARTLGRAQRTIDVNAEHQLVELTLGSGARLDLMLRGEANDADRSAVKGAEVASFFESADPGSVAEVHLLAPARTPVPLVFNYTFAERSWEYELEWLALGDRRLSEILPAGDYTLQARLPGGRVAAMPVTLTEGKTTCVVLAFE